MWIPAAALDNIFSKPLVLVLAHGHPPANLSQRSPATRPARPDRVIRKHGLDRTVPMARGSEGLLRPLQPVGLAV